MRVLPLLAALLLVLSACSSDNPTDPGEPGPPSDGGDPPADPVAPVLLVDRSDEVGIVQVRIPNPIPALENKVVAGGAAGGDIDGDGYTDLVVVSDGRGDNRIYINNGDGTFRDETFAWGLPLVTPIFESGPTLVDLDGDRDLDLLIGGVREKSDWEAYSSIMVFENTGSMFVDVTASSGFEMPPQVDTYSMSFADVDGDRDLDAFLAHWRIGDGTDTMPDGTSFARHFLWANDGSGTFTDITEAWGLGELLNTFNPGFSDVDDDGDPDLLSISDFEESQLMINQGDRFVEEPTTELTDGNGMGGAIGDYDNDGDFDWFISSVWDPDGQAEGNWDVTGNRLYQNDGTGSFTDVTDAAGVRIGYWGWGACFADFDNDGHLDLFHTNGMDMAGATIFGEYRADPSRLFMSNGDGSFQERSGDYGPVHTGQGRGVVCFDADRDGDIDLLVANNTANPDFYRNEGSTDHHWLTVSLRGSEPNTSGVGAKIFLTSAASGVQLREIRLGGNYVSQNPLEAHFGLADQGGTVDLRVEWPDGQVSTHTEVAVDQHVVLDHPGG
jgi:hypothetical protein